MSKIQNYFKACFIILYLNIILKGANKWTDSMIKKYWRYIAVVIIMFIIAKMFNLL